MNEITKTKIFPDIKNFPSWGVWVGNNQRDGEPYLLSLTSSNRNHMFVIADDYISKIKYFTKVIGFAFLSNPQINIIGVTVNDETWEVWSKIKEKYPQFYLTDNREICASFDKKILSNDDAWIGKNHLVVFDDFYIPQNDFRNYHNMLVKAYAKRTKVITGITSYDYSSHLDYMPRHTALNMDKNGTLTLNGEEILY